MELKKDLLSKALIVLLGTLVCLCLLEAGLRVGGRALLSAQDRENRAALKKGGDYRILCLGESTTSGQYPPFLEKALNRSAAGLRFVVIDEGRGSTNTAAILGRAEGLLDQYHPDMVVAMMGMNDPGEPHLLSESPAGSRLAGFVKSLKTYKLARLLFRMSLKENSWALPSWDTFRSGDPERGPSSPVINSGDGERIKELKKEILLHPGNDGANNDLGRLYYRQGRYGQAESVFKEMLKSDPGNEKAAVGLGWVYLDQGFLGRAEVVLKEAVRLNPGSDSAYIALGYLYGLRNQDLEEEDCLKKALAVDPAADRAYSLLGRLYTKMHRLGQAEKLFKEGLRRNPGSYGEYLSLARLYGIMHRHHEEEDCLKKALRLDPGKDQAYADLGWLYYEEFERYREAEELLNKAVTINPGNYRAHVGLEFLRRYKGLRLAEGPGYNKMERRHSEGYNRFTARSYNALKELLDKRKIKLVCAQYPMRSAASLKNMFDGAEGVVFVDNERVFMDAVRKEGHKAYFRDMCGVDFGHCTDKGNRLLGENIARTILAEVFGVQPK